MPKLLTVYRDQAVWERETFRITVPDTVPPEDYQEFVDEYLDGPDHPVDPNPEIQDAVEGMDTVVEIVDEVTLPEAAPFTGEVPVSPEATKALQKYINAPPELLHFDSVQAARDYAETELLATLRDDLDKMEHKEYREYTNADRKEMRDRIADLETVFALGRPS